MKYIREGWVLIVGFPSASSILLLVFSPGWTVKWISFPDALYHGVVGWSQLITPPFFEGSLLAFLDRMKAPQSNSISDFYTYVTSTRLSRVIQIFQEHYHSNDMCQSLRQCSLTYTYDTSGILELNILLC